MSCSSLLYRAFTAESYATEFLAGRFRMRRVDQYREIEDAARVDATEGLGHYVDGIGVNEHFELGNPIYVLCCSAADVDLRFLRSKMGSFVVRISDPAQLATDITYSLKQSGMKIFGDTKCRAVEYTKGSRIEDNLDEMERAELSVVQKPPLFSEEKEHRLFVVTNVDCLAQSMPAHISISLQRPLPYAEIVHC